MSMPPSLEPIIATFCVARSVSDGDVVLLLDVGAFLDEEAAHLLALGAGLVRVELHAEDLRRRAGSTSSSERASLTPPPLPRPPAWICALTTQTEPPSFCAASRRLANAERGVAARHRDAETGKDFLALVFVDLHRAGARCRARGLRRTEREGRECSTRLGPSRPPCRRCTGSSARTACGGSLCRRRAAGASDAMDHLGREAAAGEEAASARRARRRRAAASAKRRSRTARHARSSDCRAAPGQARRAAATPCCASSLRMRRLPKRRLARMDPRLGEALGRQEAVRLEPVEQRLDLGVAALAGIAVVDAAGQSSAVGAVAAASARASRRGVAQQLARAARAGSGRAAPAAAARAT